MKRLLILTVLFLLAAGPALAQKAERPARARIGLLDDARFNLYASPKDLPIARAIGEAEKLYKAQDFAKAQVAFNALQAMPGAAAVKSWTACMEAMSLANQEKYDEARAILKKVLDTDPKSDDANLADYAYGGTYKQAYDDDKAIAWYDKYLDNPDRRKDTYYFDQALEWQTEQYRSRSATSPADAALKARFHHLLDMWVTAHPDRTRDHQQLYKFFRSQDKWADCLRIAGYRMSQDEALASVLNDQLARIQETCPAAKLGAGDAAEAAKPRLDAFHAALAKAKGLSEEHRRNIHFRLVQTLMLCGMPAESDRAATAWMTAHPTDRTALYTYIGHVRNANAARPEALDRIVTDFIKTGPADDVRMETLMLYAEAAIPLYKDRSRIEKLLKENNAPATTMVNLYTGWKEDEAMAYWEKVLHETTASDDMRFKAMMQLGDRSYDKGATAQATNFYRQAMNSTQINRKYAADIERFRDRVAQEQMKEGRTDEALALLKQNIGSRNTEYWTRANLAVARADINSKDVRTLMNADQALRRILGQTAGGGAWELAVNLSDVPAIRKMQDEAKTLCEKYEIDLTRQPKDEGAWRARLKAESKAEFDKRLKTL